MVFRATVPYRGRITGKRPVECPVLTLTENGYTEQQNYPAGVEVFTGNEECGSVLFGHR